MLKLSHISCRVSGLNKVAEEFQKIGFKIEWGSVPYKSNNIFIWLGSGAFLEIFEIKKIYAPFVIFMRLTYGKTATQKWWYWYTAKDTWCDFALEEDDTNKTTVETRGKKTIVNIKKIKNEVTDLGIEVSSSTMHWKRRNCRGVDANYSYFIPKNIKLPFIVSEYKPAQKPSEFQHPNGAYKLAYIKLEVEKNDINEMRKITNSDKNIIIVPGDKTCIREIGITGLKKDINTYDVLLKVVEGTNG